MGNLFERQGLLNDVGLLKERWGQEGSDPMSFQFGTGVDATIYTVTAGKKLFINCITVSGGTDSGECQIKDGGAAGTIKIAPHFDGLDGFGGTNLSTPLIFETDVYNNNARSNTGDVTISGWEEAA